MIIPHISQMNEYEVNFFSTLVCMEFSAGEGYLGPVQERVSWNYEELVPGPNNIEPTTMVFIGMWTVTVALQVRLETLWTLLVYRL